MLQSSHYSTAARISSSSSVMMLACGSPSWSGCAVVKRGPTMDVGPQATDVHPQGRGLSRSCVMGTSGGSGLAGGLSTWCVVTSLLLVELEALESRAFMTAASLMTLLNSRSAARSLLLP